MKRRGFTITSQYGFGVKNGYGLGTEGEPPVLEAPNPPTNFLASDDELEQITFTWTNSTVGYPTPTYDIYISAGALVVSGVTSPHTETIAPGTADYIVRAVNIEDTADSNIDSGTSIEDTTAPIYLMTEPLVVAP